MACYVDNDSRGRVQFHELLQKLRHHLLDNPGGVE